MDTTREAPAPRRPLDRSAAAGRALALVTVLALATAATVQLLDLRGDDEVADARTAAVDAARAQVTGLLSVNAETDDDDIAVLLDGATSGFRDEFEKQAAAFLRSLRQGKVRSTGEVTSAGVSDFAGDHATVLVAASGTVENDQTDEPEPRYYRLSVELEKVDDRWLVSNLEFVA